MKYTASISNSSVIIHIHPNNYSGTINVVIDSNYLENPENPTWEKPQINWFACGAVDADSAGNFSEALIGAVELAKLSMNDFVKRAVEIVHNVKLP